MIINYLKEIVRNEKLKGSNDLYIRSAIKEYLQIILLQYIYTNNQYKDKFIFTGGTCLRHFFNMERLSEDLDFDIKGKINIEKLVEDIQIFFISTMQYKGVDISIKQKGRQILFKFPILKDLGLAGGSDSDLLYVKLDISEIIGKSYQTEKTSKSAFGFNFVALHYSLSSLFAGKISAILTRNLLKGKDNIQTLKGRDFYDLLWFLKKGVKVNIKLISEKLNRPELTIEKLNADVAEKVDLACTKYITDFKNDLLPFIPDSRFITDMVDNYSAEFKRYKLIAED